MNKQYKNKRNCPECGKEILYKNKCHKTRADIRNTKCKSCAKSGKFLSDETKQKRSESHMGKHSYWSNKIRSEETKKKIGNYRKGKTWSDDVRKKIRLTTLKNIIDRCGQIYPNYNSLAIPIILQKAKELDIDDLQHAENGGEFHIKELGYWVDGYSPSKNVVIEYYEKAHERTKERDMRRKKEIIKKLDCKFIEVKEYKG